MPKTTFQNAVAAAEHLTYKAGLQAIKKSEGGGQISAKYPRQVLGSVCIDEDCCAAFPNDSRWDYLIGYERGGKPIAYFVEVHSAETAEVSKLAGKLGWLMDYLGADPQSQLAKLPREIHWVASGRINIPKNTPQYRNLTVNLRKRGLLGPLKNVDTHP